MSTVPRMGDAAVTAVAPWPMYQRNAQRTGTALTPVPISGVLNSLSLGVTAALAPTVAFDASGNIYVCDQSPDGSVISVDNWSLQTEQTLGCGGPLVGPDGTVYVAGMNLVGITPPPEVTGPATLKFSISFGNQFVCTGRLAISVSPDGPTMVYAVATGGDPTSSIVVGVVIPTASGSAAVSWQTTLMANGVEMTSQASGVTLDAAGNLYVGDDSGHLYSLTPQGDLTLAATFNGPLTTPVIGPDGTVHVVSTSSAGPALCAFIPVSSATAQFFPPGVTDANASAAPAIGPPSGAGGTGSLGFEPSIQPRLAPVLHSYYTVYVGFDTIYRLSWPVPPAAPGYTLVWIGSKTGLGQQPGPIAVDTYGSAVYCGTDNYLVCYGSNGTQLWAQQLTTGGGSPTVVDSVVLCVDGNVIASVAPTAVGQIYQSLSETGQPESNNLTTYTLDEQTISFPGALRLVNGAFGAAATSEGPYSITGTLSFSAGTQTLTLTGTTTFLAAADATITLTLIGAAGPSFSLSTAISWGSPGNLADAFSALAGSFFESLPVTGLTLQQSASTTQPATGWTLSGTVGFGASSPLAQVAQLLGASPPTSAPLGGTIALDNNGHPVVNATVGAGSALSMAFGTLSLPLTIALTGSYDQSSSQFDTAIEVSVAVTVAGQTVWLSANMQTASSMVTFEAPLTPDSDPMSMANLVSWFNGSTNGLTAALPPSVGSQSQFGLETIGLTVALNVSPLSLATASLVFGAGSYTIFSASSPGVTMAISGATVAVSVNKPLTTAPQYAVEISGQVTISPMTFDVQITGPDWVISGQSDTAVTPAAAISALGGTTTLPSSAPTGPLSAISFRAWPAQSAYTFRFSSTETWPLFTAGSLDVQLGNFGLVVADAGAGVITVQALGQLTISAVFNLVGVVSSDGGWAFSLNLDDPLTLPTIGAIANAISSGSSAILPPEIASLGGSYLAMQQLDVQLAAAGGTSSLVVGIGSASGWSGWTIFTSPFTFTLTDALLTLTAAPGLTAVLDASFYFGASAGAGVQVQVTLPFEADAMTFSLVAGDGVALPTLGDLVGLINSAWVADLPPSIANLGNNISLTTFEVTFDLTTSAATAAIEIGTPASWPGITVSGFAGIAVNAFTLLLNYDGSLSGLLTLDGTLFGQSTELTASLPDTQLTATMDLTDFNLGALAQQYVPGYTDPPTWLTDIGLSQIELTVDFSTPVSVTIAATIGAGPFPLDSQGLLGTLQDVTVTASFGGGNPTSVCLSATWQPPMGPPMPGQICYPFDDLVPSNTTRQLSFPKARPSPLSSVAAQVIGGIVAAYAANELSDAFLDAIYSESADEESCAAGAVYQYGNPPSSAQLAAIVSALAQNFTSDSPTQIAQALYNGAQGAYPGLALSQSQIAQALATGLTTTTVTAAMVAQAVLSVYPNTTAPQLAQALASATFDAADVACLLPFDYPTGATAPATVTAAEVLAALQPYYSSQTSSQTAVVAALATAGFGAAEVVPAAAAAFTSITSAAGMAALLAPSYTATAAAPALYAQYAGTSNGGVASASGMVQALVPALTSDPTMTAAALAAVPYPAGDVVGAIETQFATTLPSAAAMATMLATSTPSYGPAAIAAGLLTAYAGTSPTALAQALLAANSSLAPGPAMVAIEAAGLSAAAAAVALQALWSSQKTAQGVANALAGAYGAPVVLAAVEQSYPSAVSTAVTACQVLFATSVYTSAEATTALLAAAFTPSDVQTAVSQVYGAQ